MSDKYVAYVGSYTYVGRSKGIMILDCDMEKGRLRKRKEIEVNNASYLAISHSGKYLYSIIDEGLESFRILPDGDLESMNKAMIRGMRGCYIEIDPEDKYIFTAGYHDGKVTALKLNPDGTVGEITAGIFHRGFGTSVKQGRARVTCVKLTPDCKWLLASDGGTDHVKIYDFNRMTGALSQCDILRLELQCAPKCIEFSNDGKYMYVVSQGLNLVEVFSYDGSGKRPEFQLLQKVPTCDKRDIMLSSACTFEFSSDQSHAFVSNEGDSSICIYDRDTETGLLTKRCVSPVSGEYPKGIAVFPDDKHIVSVNNVSHTLTFFSINYEKGMLIMSGKPVLIDEPNDCIFHKLPN